MVIDFVSVAFLSFGSLHDKVKNCSSFFVAEDVLVSKVATMVAKTGHFRCDMNRWVESVGRKEPESGTGKGVTIIN